MEPAAAVASTTLNGTSRVSGRLAGKLAFTLFRRPRGRSRVRPVEQTLMDSAEVERFTVNGRSVATYRWGSGERPVLLVHGWESRGSRFAGIISGLLERGYSPVAFDAPGHGGSTGRSTTILEFREVILRLHEKHGDFEALVAHSFGVMSAVFALHHGVRAGRFVAISGVPDFAYLVDGFCLQLGLRTQLKKELRARIESELFPGEEDIWTRFSAVNSPDSVPGPVLVVHDEDDDMVGPEQAGRFTAAYGDRAHLLTTRGLGHRRILGDPEVVEAVLRFVADGQLPPARTAAAVLPG